MKNSPEVHSLNVNGNKIGVCILDSSQLYSISSNLDLRKNLVNKYKNKLDTLMLTDFIKPNVIETVVFEPNSGTEHGSFSFMCGNGLRAIHQVTDAEVFFTPAGSFFTEIIKKKTFICTRSCVDIASQGVFTKPNFEKVKQLLATEGVTLLKCCICANQQSDFFSGEPHFVLLLESGLGSGELAKIATKLGFNLSFLLNPNLQTNVTFVSHHSKRKASVCTFERNLGQNPQMAITGSCGTGAMAAANVINSFFFNAKGGEFSLLFPKDVQVILIKAHQTYILTNKNYENI